MEFIMIVENRVQECVTPTQMNLIFNSRIFWRQFATWTRAYFRSRYLGLGNASEVFARLYSVPVQFGSLSLIFGNQFSQGYTYLLQQHVILLRDLISAQMEGDIDAVNQYVQRLYQNAYERAKFLSLYNPFLNEMVLRSFFEIYVQYTIEEANAFATRDFGQSITLYENLTTHTNKLGDYFAQGLFDYIIYNPSNSNLERQRLKELKNQLNGIPCITYDQMELIYSLRMLWYELTTWTRAYFISVYEDIPENTANVLARLNEIPRQYANILTPFFGGEATEQNIALIYEYIQLVVALVNAQREGNVEAVNQATQLLYQNLNKRANLLSSIDPYFEQTQWQNMQTNYTRYTIEEATAFLVGDHETSLNVFDRLLALSLDLGDFFANELFTYIR